MQLQWEIVCWNWRYDNWQAHQLGSENAHVACLFTTGRAPRDYSVILWNHVGIIYHMHVSNHAAHIHHTISGDPTSLIDPSSCVQIHKHIVDVTPPDQMHQDCSFADLESRLSMNEVAIRAPKTCLVFGDSVVHPMQTQLYSLLQ